MSGNGCGEIFCVRFPMICAAIIKAHGSEIHARNLESGGAEFTFALEMEEDYEQ